MPISNVYVVQENPNLDYSDAERFGDVTFVTNIEYSSVSGSLNNQDLHATLERVFGGKFDPSNDYLLMTGNPVTLGYAFHLALMNAASCGEDGIKLLRWDGHSQSYREIHFKP